MTEENLVSWCKIPANSGWWLLLLIYSIFSWRCQSFYNPLKLSNKLINKSTIYYVIGVGGFYNYNSDAFLNYSHDICWKISRLSKPSFFWMGVRELFTSTWYVHIQHSCSCSSTSKLHWYEWLIFALIIVALNRCSQCCYYVLPASLTTTFVWLLSGNQWYSAMSMRQSVHKMTV